MTAATRSATRTPTPELPRIPRRTTEVQERDQIQYLIWRLTLFLKDAGAPREERERIRSRIVTAFRGGAAYGRLCEIIEEEMTGFLARQAQTIQAIFNEK